MSFENFQRTVWCKKINKKLPTITGLKNHSDLSYEGEVENAKELKILGIEDIAIKKYVKGTKLERDHVSDKSQMLKLDQKHYFDFDVYDVDQAQSNADAMEAYTENASQGLSEKADQYIGELVADATLETPTIVDNPHIDSVAIASLKKDTIVGTIEEAFVKLYENNVKTTQDLHLEVRPAVFSMFRQALTELFTNNVEMAKQGIVGKYSHALVSIENNLGQADGKFVNILRTKKAVAYAGCLRSVEPFRPEDDFCDALKGLFVFGARIVNPKQIVGIIG